jgi:hypothetical protein
MQRAILAGLAYFAPVMAAAFALGVIRVTMIVPALGSTLAAVALEVPLVLLISWLVVGAVLRRMGPFSNAQALLLGLSAFAMLMISEMTLAQLITGQSGLEWLSGLGTPTGLLGLASQIIFACIPAIRNRAAT